MEEMIDGRYRDDLDDLLECLRYHGIRCRRTDVSPKTGETGWPHTFHVAFDDPEFEMVFHCTMRKTTLDKEEEIKKGLKCTNLKEKDPRQSTKKDP